MLLVLVAVARLALAQDTDTTFAVRQGQRLDVSDFGGSVVIKTWRQSAVRVRATHGSRDYVTITTEGPTVHIGATSRHGPAMVDYEILAPAWMPLSVSGAPSAEVTIEGTEAEVTVETVEGSIRVVGGSGNISLKSVEGEVTLEGANGHIELNTWTAAFRSRTVPATSRRRRWTARSPCSASNPRTSTRPRWTAASSTTAPSRTGPLPLRIA